MPSLTPPNREIVIKRLTLTSRARNTEMAKCEAITMARSMAINATPMRTTEGRAGGRITGTRGDHTVNSPADRAAITNVDLTDIARIAAQATMQCTAADAETVATGDSLTTMVAGITSPTGTTDRITEVMAMVDVRTDTAGRTMNLPDTTADAMGTITTPGTITIQVAITLHTDITILTEDMDQRAMRRHIMTDITEVPTSVADQAATHTMDDITSRRTIATTKTARRIRVPMEKTTTTGKAKSATRTIAATSPMPPRRKTPVRIPRGTSPVAPVMRVVAAQDVQTANKCVLRC